MKKAGSGNRTSGVVSGISLWRRRVLSWVMCACTLVSLLSGAPKALADYTTPAFMQWWADARFGMFIHFGSYSYQGQGEWVMYNGNYSKQAYQTQISQPFNPTNWNASGIVNAAKAAGMKYIVITAKHHEGFAMFPRTTSSFTDYTGSTIYSLPAYTTAQFSRDVLMELKNACDAQGIKFCLYYSILDWNHPSQTMRSQGPGLTTMSSLTARSAYIADMKMELSQLISRYNPALLWFDGDWFGEPATATLDDWWLSTDGQDLYNYLKSINANIVINERVKRDFGLGDYAVAEFGTPSAPMSRAWERCDTMNGAWGYDSSKQTSSSYRSAHDMIQEWVTIASREGNFLLNIGPDGTGTVPPLSLSRLNDIAAWSGIWAGSLYGVTRSPFLVDPTWGTFTKKSGFLYCHIFTYPAGGSKIITVPAITNTISKIYMLNSTNTLLGYTTSGGYINITLPSTNPDSTGIDAVAVIECGGMPVAAPLPPLANGTYKLIDRNSSKAMWESGTSNGSLVEQNTVSMASSYKWNVQSIGGGQYRITNVASGRALGVYGASTADGANIVIWDSNTSNDQKWIIQPIGYGYYTIYDVNSGKVIGINGGSTANGATCVQWTSLGGLDQQWSFQ